MGRKKRPALSLEERENEMISLATELCEERMRNGTATAQEIIHFLRLGTVKAKKELELIELDKQLLIAKTEAIESAKSSEELYSKALKAMRVYSGNEEDEEEYDEDQDLW